MISQAFLEDYFHDFAFRGQVQIITGEIFISDGEYTLGPYACQNEDGRRATKIKTKKLLKVDRCIPRYLPSNVRALSAEQVFQ